MRARSRGMWAFALVFGMVWLVAGGAPASAHTDEPVNTKGEVLSPSILPTSAKYPNSGGWSGGNKYVTDPTSILGAMAPKRVMLSETFVISEPYRTASGKAQVEIKVQGSRVDTDGTGGIEPVRWGAIETVFYCKSPVSGSPVTTTYFGSVHWNAQAYGWAVPLQTWQFTGCDLGTELVAVELYAHTRINRVAGPNGNMAEFNSLQQSTPSLANPGYKTATSCYVDCTFVVGETMRTVWYPGLFIDYTPFDNALKDFGDGNPGAICLANPNAAQCQVVNLWAPYDKAASWAVCEGAPDASITSLDWLPGLVGHYVKCLFVPSAGFPMTPVLWEIDNSELGESKKTIEGVVAALPHKESCGVVMDTSIQGVPLRLDTCAWSAWAPAKTYITMAAFILAGFASLNLLLSVLLRREMRTDGE